MSKTFKANKARNLHNYSQNIHNINRAKFTQAFSHCFHIYTNFNRNNKDKINNSKQSKIKITLQS